MEDQTVEKTEMTVPPAATEQSAPEYLIISTMSS